MTTQEPARPAETVTAAGHSPEAVALLTGALKPFVDEPFSVAVAVFSVLHDAGLRIVPRRHSDGGEIDG